VTDVLQKAKSYYHLTGKEKKKVDLKALAIASLKTRKFVIEGSS
jgi:hypothetical protein